MRIKQPIIIMAALALSLGAKAQSVDEGIKMYNYHKYESAKRALTSSAANNPLANYYMGLSELRLGHIDAAQALFAKYPENYANMGGMAQVSFSKGNATEGMQLATALAGKAKKKDWEPYKYAADAITYTKGGDINTAIGWYNKALAINDNAELHIGLGDAYLQLATGGGEAMNNYEKVVAKDPKNSLAYSRIGTLWYDARKYDDALSSWEKAREADPANPIPYGELGDAYMRVGKYEKSTENLTKFLELSDRSTEDMVKHAGVLYLAKDYNGAIKEAQDLINSGNGSARMYGVLGFSQFEVHDSANALINARKYIVGVDPKEITSNDYRQYAKIFLKNNMADSANYYLEKAISMEPAANKSDAYRDNADMLREAKEWKLAATWYKKLATEFPDKARALDYYYWGLGSYVVHDFSEAAQGFEQMETKFPDQPSSTYWRGRTAAAIDSNAENGPAVPFYNKWLGINVPGYERKPADLLQAYQYLAIYYYHKNDMDNLKKTLDDWAKADPNAVNNALYKQLTDVMNKPKSSAPASKPAPKKGK